MKQVLKKLLQSIGITTELFFALIAFYFTIFFVLAPFTSEKITTSDVARHEVIIIPEGIHTDILLPIRTKTIDWGKELHIENGLKVDTFQTHLKFGYGDKNFFLQTKNWGDLTAKTLFRTIFGINEGAIHVNLCSTKDLDTSKIITLQLSDKQFHKLIRFIKNSIKWSKGYPQQITNHPYSQYDFFFNSSKDYSVAYTCNCWTNEGLKSSEQKAGFWTPFKELIFSKYHR
jgi:uncharacterized protein (TIGR02117 family)